MSKFKNYPWFAIGVLTGLFILFLSFPYVIEWNNDRQERQDRVEYIESITQPELRIYQSGVKVLVRPTVYVQGGVMEYYFLPNQKTVKLIRRIYPNSVKKWRYNNNQTKLGLRDLIDERQNDDPMYKTLQSL